jgi:hypothetical protein
VPFVNPTEARKGPAFGMIGRHETWLFSPLLAFVGHRAGTSLSDEAKPSDLDQARHGPDLDGTGPGGRTDTVLASRTAGNH